MATNEIGIRLSLTGQERVAVGVQQVNDELGGLGRSAQASAAGSDRLATAMGRIGQMAHGLVLQQIAQSAGQAAQALFEASASAQNLQTKLQFATGNGPREAAFVADVADRLGISLRTAEQAYAGFAAAARGTVMEGARAREVFEAMSKASAVMGLSADETNGALLAVQQMMSKGKVSAEEFRGQLGERMPIALQAGAKALGVTAAEFNKLMESGKIVSEDFLPKFARALNEMLGDSADKAANRLDASVARMGNAWERLKQSLGDSGISQAMAREYSAAAVHLNAISDSMEAVKSRGAGMATQIVAGIGQGVGRLGFDVLSQTFNLFNGTVNTLSGGFVRLRTNLDLLPNALRSNAEMSKILGADLARAEVELKALQDRAGLAPENIYLKSEMAQLQRYIAELRRAKSERDLMEAAATGSDSVKLASLRARRDDTERHKAQKKAAEDLMEKYATKPEKMAKALEEARKQAGSFFTPELEKHIRDHFKEDAKEKDGTYARLTARVQDFTAAQRAELDAGKELTAGEKLAADVKAELERAGSKVTAQQKQRIMTDLQAALAVEKQTASQRDAAKVAEEYAKALEQTQNKADGLRRTMADSLLSQREQYDDRLSVIGLGSQSAERMASRIKIEREYARFSRQLTEEAAKNKTLESDAYKKGMADIESSLERALDANERYYGRVDELRGSTMLGLSQAVANYSDSAADLFGQTETLTSNALRGMEDSLVKFVQTGKLSFSDLANSIVADLTRMIVKQVMFNALAGMMSGSVGETAANAMSGDSLDNFISLNNGFGTTPGRASGGSVSSGGLYQVNEQGPELLHTAGKTYLMMGSQGGSVTPHGGMGAGTQVSVVVNNNAGRDTQATASSRTDAMGNTVIDVLVEKVEAGMMGRVSRGAGMAPLLERRYGLNPAAGAIR